MITDYRVHLFKKSELIRSTTMSISDRDLSLQQAAAHLKLMMMAAEYDRDYDSFVISEKNGGFEVHLDLVDD